MIHFSSAFDGGNGALVSAATADDIRVTIDKDVGDRFMQWFYFRVTAPPGTPLVIRVMNAGEASYAKGYEDYRAVASSDRERWSRVPTSFDGEVMRIDVTAEAGSVWLAYFAPYSMERHAGLVARAQSAGARLSVLGETLDGQALDLLELGSGEESVWAIARQHPGETMAEHWMEGFVERLIDPADPVARALLERATLRVVPNMNPDGSRRGHLRTNAAGANLNRAWLEPTMEASPEVYLVRERMGETGVDLCLDVHGDEELPFNFIAGPDGIPSHTPELAEQLEAFKRALAEFNPDFQTERGYPRASAGQANLSMCTNWVAEHHGCLAMTLEMPFKDAANRPMPDVGWSPARARHLGRSCVDAIWRTVGS